MFGTIKPSNAKLSGKARQQYKQLYCGVCAGLGTHLDTASRITLSHDTVLLATLIESLLEKPSRPSKTRCPMMPLHFRATLDEHNNSIQYAVGVQGFLVDQWFADKVMDGNRAARQARRIWQPRALKSIELLNNMGLSLYRFRNLDKQQSYAEQQYSVSIQRVMAPTEHLLSAVFAHIATFAPDASGTTLGKLGGTIGKIIYLADALEDITKDMRKAHFNPCLRIKNGTWQIDSRSVSKASRLLKKELASLPTILNSLPIKRHRNLLEAILLEQWPACVEKIIARAEILANQEEEVLSVMQRWQLLMVAVSAFWLSMIRASQQTWAFQRQSFSMAFGFSSQSCPPQASYAHATIVSQGVASPSIMLNVSSDQEQRKRDEFGEEKISDGCECCCDVCDCCTDCPCGECGEALSCCECCACDC